MCPAHVCQPITRVTHHSCVMVDNSANCCLSTTRTSLHTNDTLSTGTGRRVLPGVLWPRATGRPPAGTPTEDRSPPDGSSHSDGDLGMGGDRIPSPQSSAFPCISALATGLCRRHSSNSLVSEDPRLPLPCLPARSRLSGLCSPFLRAHPSLCPPLCFPNPLPSAPLRVSTQESKRQKLRGALQHCAPEHIALPALGLHVTQLHSEGYTGGGVPCQSRGPVSGGFGLLPFSFLSINPLPGGVGATCDEDKSHTPRTVSRKAGGGL